MMKYLSLLSFIFIIHGTAMAQEKIYKTDGTVLNVTILEQTSDFVIFNDADNKKQVLERSKIEKIEKVVPVEEYVANDEVIAQGKTSENKQYTEDYGKNIISFNYLEFGILLNLNFSYERIMADGFLGMTFSGAYSPGTYYASSFSNVVYYYSERYMFDINIYPAGQHRASYFIGPSLGYGTYLTENFNQGQPDEEHSFSTFLLNNGVVLSITPNFALSGKVGLGVVRSFDEGRYSGIELSIPLFAFNIAGRF